MGNACSPEMVSIRSYASQGPSADAGAFTRSRCMSCSIVPSARTRPSRTYMSFNAELRSQEITGPARVDLRGALKSKLNIPVFVDNDANGAALAELSFGQRVGKSDLCLLFLDVGVGAGLIFNRSCFEAARA